MSEADWTQFLRPAQLAEPQPPWWAFPPLALTARYFNTIPADVLETLALCCPWVLKQFLRTRSLTHVSLSNPWISAFPGIEWASSARDMLEYVRRRILPDREMIEARRQTTQMEPAGDVGADWANLSQSRRVLRWLTSRPARTQTLSAVQAALARAR